MATVELRLTGAWAEFQRAIDPVAFRRRLEPRLQRAGALIGHRWRRSARRRIRQSAYAPNSPLTIILKGSSKPLIAGGDLFQSLTFHQPNPYEVQLGLVRGRVGVGEEMINVGLILHEGATINVGAKPQVRVKVWSMVTQALKASGSLRGASRRTVFGAAGSIAGGGRRAGSVWVIPPRPFITDAIDESFTNFAFKAYSRAVSAALAEPKPRDRRTQP